MAKARKSWGGDMAEILWTNGGVNEAQWSAAGNNSALLRQVFGDRMVTTFRTRDGRMVIADDNGLIDELPYNARATRLYQENGGLTPILGNAIVLTQEETRADMEAL